MRQVRKFFIAAFVAASAVLFMGCPCEIDDPCNPDCHMYDPCDSTCPNYDPSKCEDPPPPPPDPSITSVSINGGVRNAFTVDEGTAVNLIIDYSAPAGIKRIEFVKGSANVTGFPITSNFSTSTTHKYQGAIPASFLTVGANTFTTKVIDNADKQAEQTITITVEGGEPINTWTNRTLGSFVHASTAGSSFATSNGTVYSLGDAKTNSGIIDIIYLNGSQNPFALVAPNFAAIGNLPGNNNNPNRVEAWDHRNATRFARLSNVTAQQFDACINDRLIVQHVTTAAVTANSVTNLAANNIVGFITAGGKRGLIKVVSTNTGSTAANESITIDVKVQQ